jgi:hypothetical protein
VYFWLRLGYRPLTSAQAPWPLAGLSQAPRRGIWMVREGTDVNPKAETGPDSQ